MFYNINCLQNQYVAAFAAALTLMVSGTCFVWVSPVLPLLEGPDALIPMTMTQISWMISLVEVGSAFSPLISGVISERCGRKPAILLGGPFLIFGWVLILTTRDAISLYIVRFFHGFGMGVVFTVIPIYLGEIAEAKVRGGITSLLQTLWYTGFLLQYNIGSILSYQNSALLNLVLTTIIFVFFYFSPPESPYYFMVKNKQEKASKSLMLLRGKKTTESVATELKLIKDIIDQDMKNKYKWTDVFNLSKIDYKILLLVQILSVHRLCSGTVSISTYINELLRRADWQAVSPELTMTIYGSVTLITIIIATLSIDWIGRRPLLIFSSIGVTISNLCLAGFYYINDYHKEINLDSIRWFPAAALIMFTMFFGIGLGPVTQTIQSELFPTNIRALGNVVTSYNLTITSFACLRFFQVVIDNFGMYANFLLYALNSMIAIFVVYKYVPETKGKTFLEISEFFSKKYDKGSPKMIDTKL